MARSAKGIPDRDRLSDLRGIRPGQILDWIVQEHNARRAGRHYDLRFGNPDLGLVSFAIPKAQLPKPGERRLAVPQPLHEYGYKDFEGKIEEGYGAGDVKQVQSGSIQVRKVGPDFISFTRIDTRTPQRFLLRRGKDGKWLLINTTPRERVGEKFPKIHYTSVPADQAEKALENLQPGSSVQAKVDGASTLVQILDDRVEAFSQRTSKVDDMPIVHSERISGGDVGKLRPAKIPPKSLLGTVLRGELVAVDPRTGRAAPPQVTSAILNSSPQRAWEILKDKGLVLKNLLFDVVQKGKRRIDYNRTPYQDRRKEVESVVPYLPESYEIMPEVEGDPKNTWRRVIRGEEPLTREGLVVHPPLGKPIKIKGQKEFDVYIHDVFPGQGKYLDVAGGFRYSLQPGGKPVGRVGSGLDDLMRRRLWEDRENFRGRVARVRASEVLPSGALRHPVFLALHEG